MNERPPQDDEEKKGRPQIMGVARLLAKTVTITYEAGGKAERRTGLLESVGPFTTLLVGTLWVSIRSETIVEIAQTQIVPANEIPKLN